MASIQTDRADGLSSATAIKGPVKVATTANISLNGLQTVDGVALAVDDRVLVKSQTDSRDNGIWVVDTGPWRRAKDFSSNPDIRNGTRVWVTHGTVAGPKEYSVTTANPIALGTSLMTFALSGVDAQQALAELAAEAAQAAASSVSPTEYPSVATAEALTPISAPLFIRTAGFAASGDGGGALYKKVVSEPSHEGKFSITLSGGGTAWYELAETTPSIAMFGAPLNGTGDDAPFVEDAIEFVGTGGTVIIPADTVNLDSDVDGTGIHIIDRGATYSGIGIIKAAEVTTDAGSDQRQSTVSAYVQRFGARNKRSLADIARFNPGSGYPDKFVPVIADFELLRLSPAVTVFERTSDGTSNFMTAEYIREVVRDCHASGVKNIRTTYSEFGAFKFYRSDMPEWANLDSAEINWATTGTVNLTLSATGGPAVTVNASAAIFTVGSDVGKWIWNGTGMGKIQSVASTTQCVISTLVDRGSSFGSTSVATDTWNIAYGTKFWADWLGVYPNVEDFDPTQVILDECQKLGMGVIVGLTRGGDVNLLNDIYAVNILASPDPVRHFMTLSQRITYNVNLNREMAADIWARFGHYPSLAGLYFAHEPDHIASAANLFGPINTVDGVHPAIRSYGLPIVMAPSSPIDLAADATFANAIISCACDIIEPQDSVGPGLDFATGEYTYIPSLTIADLAEHFALWRRAIDLANGKSASTSLYMILIGGLEVWQMGAVNAFTTLTVNATNPAAVVLTPDLETFTAFQVSNDYWISSAGGGQAKMLSIDASTPKKATVDTTVSGGRAYEVGPITPGNWAFNLQYSADYPAAFSRMQNTTPSSTKTQFSEIWPFVDGMCIYAWLGFVDPGTHSLRPAQSQPNNPQISDWRTRAVALHTGLTGFLDDQITKYSDMPSIATISDQWFDCAVADLPAAGTTVTKTLGTFTPKSDGSTVDIELLIQGAKAAGAATVTCYLNVKAGSASAVDVANHQFVVGTDGTGIAATIPYRTYPKGEPLIIVAKVVSSSGNFTASRLLAKVVEKA